jgi:hypothetical protein
MVVYFFIFGLLVASVVYGLPRMSPLPGRRKERFPLGFLILLVLFIGLRHETGGDWYAYAEKIADARTEPFLEAILLSDPGYAVINWISARLFGSVHFVNLVCALVFCWGLVRFANRIGNTSMVLLLAFPYLVIVVGMGYTRQAAAMGLIMIGIVGLLNERWLSFIVFVVLASLFHKSAFLVAVFGVLANSKNRIFGIFVTCLAVGGLYILLVLESIESFTQNYLEAEYEASGAWVRVAMTVLPAVMFMLFGRHFGENTVAARRFWGAFAIGALLLPVAMMVSPSSVAVDRISLYWYPFQLMTWASLAKYLPNWRYRYLVTAGLITYAGASLLVWMFWSPNALDWIPYRFLPFEAF